MRSAHCDAETARLPAPEAELHRHARRGHPRQEVQRVAHVLYGAGQIAERDIIT